MELGIFYALAALVLFAGTMVITVQNPVHAVLFLVLAFFGTAGLWLLLEAEFLAIALVLVYVGAVMVLFLFVVMMLDINLVPLREGFARYLPFGAAVALALASVMGFILGPRYFGLAQFPPPAPLPADHSNTTELGRLLYTYYLYPFEVAAVILLVAIIAAIALTQRARRQTKAGRPEWQVGVRRQDRVRLLSLPAEKPAKEGGA
ncbi:MAG TPA: NADH-quinone oxidoreductase subunit J [Gammaproteobacteria bacterium]|nr:NADH-quinone oxidoreductase subunit J [Gammaproteobacteria bacterium]